jgi:protein-S-isoprenylcysteine O-methyltransferase Ste14
MPAYWYGILAAAWGIWLLPFSMAGRKREKSETVDKRARWGMLLEAIAYSLLWQGKFWLSSPATWRWSLSLLFFALAALLSWTSVSSLGSQWRVDAGIQSGHELVTRGAYRLVRHPIYASMLCMLLGTGLLITPLPLLAAALIVCAAGTEIRVRIEDRLLEVKFREVFRDYRRRVPAYIPFLK